MMGIVFFKDVRVSNTIVREPYCKQIKLVGVYRYKILQPIYLLQVFLETV